MYMHSPDWNYGWSWSDLILHYLKWHSCHFYLQVPLLGTTKQKEFFTYSHFLKPTKKQNRQNRTTKYVQEGKGYVDLNFFNFVSHCMCKKHQPIIDLYGAKLQLTAVLTLKWPSRSSPISPYYISFSQKNI